MGTPVVYNQFKLKQHNGNAIDLDTDTIKVLIVSSVYIPSQSHAFVSDISNEVTGVGYTAGGKVVTGVTLTLDGNTVKWLHDDITWVANPSGFTNGRHFIWYHSTGNPSTSKLIMYMSESVNFGNSSGDLTLDGSATTGVLNIV